MKYLSLFSGIGGLDLALDELGHEAVGQVEIDPFCLRVLGDRWPTVPKVLDVKTLRFSRSGGVDLIVGGFPCQPVSYAGRGLAQDDPRWLWPEFARLIGETQATSVFIENVPGLRTRGLDLVLADLTELGYGGAWDIVSAADVGAWHLRKRLWILAERGRSGFDGRTDTKKKPTPTAAYRGGAVEKPTHSVPTPTSSDMIERRSTNTGGPSHGELNFDTMKSVSLDRFARQWPSPRVGSGGAVGGSDLRDQAEGKLPRHWPTPGAQDSKWRATPNVSARRLATGRTIGLEDAVMLDRAPTPTARLGMQRGPQAKRYFDPARSNDLDDYVAAFPTPTSRDHKDAGPNVNFAKIAAKSKLAGVVALDEATTGEGPLNPAWVEWLMGFPIGWTDLTASDADLIAWGWDVEPTIPRLARGIPQRRERLMAIGNAVVPQAAMAAFEHLRERLG